MADHNEDIFAKYGAQAIAATDSMGLPSTIVYGALAATVDFGATVWNSLPMTEDVSTSDLLGKIDTDALAVYNEHPDAVHAASFIGGSFVPVGLALKGMSALRAGSKSVNWFSTAGKTANYAKVEEAMNNAVGASELVRKAERNIYGAMAANALVDSVAAEAALTLTMNAHPYMEDYNKDFAGNFAFWAATGGVLGGTIGLIGEKALLRNLKSGIETKAMGEVTKGLEEVSPALMATQQLQIMQRNVEKNQAKILRAEDASDPSYTLNDRTLGLLKFHTEREQAFIARVTESMVSGELKTVDAVVRKDITDWMLKDSRVTGVDKARFYSPVEVKYPVTLKAAADIPTFFKAGKQKIVDAITGKVTKVPITRQLDSVYIPLANEGKGGFTSVIGARNFSTIADIANGSIKTIEDIAKNINPNFADADAFLAHAQSATHEVDAAFAASLLKVEKATLAELSAMKVASTDLPMLKAVKARLNTLTFEEAASTSITVNKKKLNLLDFDNLVTVAHDNSVSELIKLGAAPETIALRTGTPIETILNDMRKLPAIDRNILKYRASEDIVAAIDHRNRALVLSSNEQKVNNASIAANLHISIANNYNALLTHAHMASSKSDLVRGIADTFGTEDNATLISTMLAKIDQVTPSGLKTPFFTSLNAAMEHFGIAGTIAVQLGKDTTTIRNKMIDKFIKPISESAGKFVKDEAKLVEHNLAVNFNAGLKDWRTFDATTGQFMVREVSPKGVVTLVPAKDIAGNTFTIVDPTIRETFALYNTAGREIYEMINVSNKVLGKPLVTDIGFWIPAFNPREKQIAYAFNKKSGTITLLHTKTAGELNDAVDAYRKRLLAEGNNDVQVFTKGVEQKIFNDIAGRHDPMYMAVADITMKHGGSSAATFVKTNSEPLSEIINGFDHSIGKGINDILELRMQPVMDRLKLISDASQIGFEKGTLGVSGVFAKKLVDPGQIMRNAILGKANLSEYSTWQSWQRQGQAITDVALQTVSNIFGGIINPVTGLFKTEKRTDETWKVLNTKLAANGFTPYSHVDDFLRYKSEGTVHPESITPRLIALSNGLASTVLLRFLEAAQPFVNMVSLPILTSGAISRKLDASFMDGVLDPAAKFSVHSAMSDGVRLMMHPIEGTKWKELGEKNHLFASIVSEATEILQHSKSIEGGVISKIEEGLQSQLVRLASSGSDYSESLVRQMAFFTGIGMAKKAYPGLSDVGTMTFARSFMDEAIGNYTASQRPVAFQGTFGVAMGLFQTYMLTLGQHMYRQIETKDWAALGKMMLTQQTIFGASSLPGFHNVSEMIGTHFSDNHIDLETGTFRAIGDDAATMLLYGLPSSFGPGITTRGDIQPRVPNPFIGVDAIAAVNIGKQAYNASERLISAAFTADKSTGKAMLEALSLQSVSRPVARVSELINGYSITGAGEVVTSPAEMYTMQSIGSRLMATRPIEEIKARQAIQLNSTYGAVDSDNRREITKKLKTYIRDGNLDGDKIQELQYEYMRSGTVGGWRSAVNEALTSSTLSGNANVRDNLSPNKPWQLMLDDLEK